MVLHARCATPVRINQDWVLLVLAVPLHQYLQLAAPQTPHVNATQGTRGQMERHARSAFTAPTKLDWGLVLVNCVPLNQALRRAVP